MCNKKRGFALKKILSLFYLLLLAGLLSGCGSMKYRNTVRIADGEILVNGEKCEVVYMSEARGENGPGYYIIHANIDWDLKSFRDDNNSYKVATKDVITFYDSMYHFEEKDYSIMIQIINDNKDYHYNRIALWVNHPTQFHDSPHISWYSNSFSNNVDELWAPSWNIQAK